MKKLLLISCIFACMHAEAASRQDDPFVEHLATISRLVAGSPGTPPIDPKSIAVVFDIHGTLSTKSDPETPGEELPRWETIKFLEKLETLGVNVILSSAHNEPASIIKSIHICGLERFLGTEESLQKSLGPDLFDVWRSGKLVSVRPSHSRDKCFRSKALAPLFTNDLPKPIEYLLLVEDAAKNIMWFFNDAEKYAIHLFGPDKAPSWKDMISAVLLERYSARGSR